MTSHYVVGDSPFLKRVLLPFWIIRDIFMVLYILSLAVGLYWITSASRDDVDSTIDADNSVPSSSLTAGVIAIFSVSLAIDLICLALDIVCIVKRARRTLSPKFFLVVNCIQTFVWTVIFATNLVGAIGAGTPLSMIVSIIIYASFLGLLIYAGVIFHKARKGTLRKGGYNLPATNKDTELAQLNTAYPSYASAPYNGAGYSEQPVGVASSYYDPHAAVPSHSSPPAGTSDMHAAPAHSYA